MVGKAYTWKASGLVAVTAAAGRLFHKGIVSEKKEFLWALVLVGMCRNKQGCVERVRRSAARRETGMGGR